MALLRYAVVGVLRSRRRTFSSILGVLLAITFVAGTFIAIDSSTRATLDALLANVPGDFGIYATGDASDIRRAVTNVSGVRDVTLYRPVPANELASDQVPFTRYAYVLGIEPDHLPVQLQGAEVVGSLDLPRGSIGLSREVASELQVSLDGRVSLQYRAFDFQNQTEIVISVNFTVAALLTFADTGGLTPGPIIGPGPYYGPIAVVHIRDVDWIAEQFQIVGRTYETIGEVWVEHARFIDPYDLDATNRNLARLERQLIVALSAFFGQVQNNLSSALTNFTFAITAQRIVFLGLSLPVVLLGLYLGAVGVDLGHAERRRELAVLKARGAGQSQVTRHLLIEAILGGVIAGVLGLVTGIALSRLLLSVVNPFGLASAPRYEEFVLSIDTIVTVCVLSVLLMAAVSYRSAKRTSALPIVETLRYYAPGETRIAYRPTADLVLVSLALVTFGGALYTRFTEPSILYFLFGVIFIVLLPFAPILLIIGATRLLTRSTGRVYEWTARVFRPFAKNLDYVISRNVARNPRRSANVALIIAFGLAFGMFVFASYGSQQAYQVRLLRDSIGADVVARWAPSPSDATIVHNLTRIPGVAGVARFANLFSETQPGGAAVVALDPDEYFAVTQPESYYFLDTPPAEAVDLLSTPGEVLVSKMYFDGAFLATGDRVQLTTYSFNTTSGNTTRVDVNVTVAGVLKGLPGSGSGPFPSWLVFGSFETFTKLIPASGDASRTIDMRFFVDLASGADWRTVKQAILDEGAISVRVFEEEMISLFEQPSQRAFLGFFGMEIGFVIVILTAGLGLIMVAATLERDVEFAGITARGSSGWQTASLLIGEAFSIMMVGVLVGVSVGLATAYMTLQISSVTPGFPEPIVPLVFQMALEGFILIAVAPAAMLSASLLVSWKIARMDVARVLKLRGG